MKTKKTKDPAFLFYSADFLVGTLMMSDAEVGQYVRLLCLQHQKGDLSESDVLKICGGKLNKKILTKFVKTKNGNYFNERLRNESKKRENFRKKMKKNAEKRWSGNIDEQSVSMQVHMQKDMQLQCNYENENENINDNKNKKNGENFLNDELIQKPILDQFNRLSMERFISSVMKSNAVSDEHKRTFINWHCQYSTRQKKYIFQVRGFDRENRNMGSILRKWAMGSYYPPQAYSEFKEIPKEGFRVINQIIRNIKTMNHGNN